MRSLLAIGSLVLGTSIGCSGSNDAASRGTEAGSGSSTAAGSGGMSGSENAAPGSGEASAQTGGSGNASNSGGSFATGGTGNAPASGGADSGSAGATGGSASTGSDASTSTGGVSSTDGGASGGSPPPPLDCGPNGWVVENHGPVENRVNYVILGDGYTSDDLGSGGVFETHIENAMSTRFSTYGEVYGRYRNFVNICAIKIVSDGAICSGSNALGCCGDDASRLASCDSTKVNAAFDALPASLTIDWRAVVLNGSSWWNTGAATMLWSGGNSNGPKAALHEGGHGFHQLADEYCASTTGTNCGADTNGTGTVGTEYSEVNSTGNPVTTGGKWDLWLGFDQSTATGVQGTFEGSRYVDTGQYRPSANSIMNSLFGTDPNTSFNPVSQEQMIMTIWRIVKPIDSVSPPAGAVTGPGTLTVNVIDPAVISVDWTVDAGAPQLDAGNTFDTSMLATGTHTVTARAYDNAGDDLVRYTSSTCPSAVTGRYCSRTAWANSSQTVTWTVTR